MTKSLAKIGRARAIVRYFRDREASLLGKLFVLAALVYVVSPVDFIPDAIPIVGWLDDVGVMSLAVAWMWRIVGRYREPEEKLLAPDERYGDLPRKASTPL